MVVRVGVIGQGYVGLPLALAAAGAGYHVVGVDINQSVVDSLNNGFNHISAQSDHELEKHLNSTKYFATTDYSELSDCSIKLICVPTPLSDSRLPNLDPLISAIKGVAKQLNEKDLVIIESTIAPGTTRCLILPLLEEISGFSRDKFMLAFSPERIDPANKIWNIENTPKLVAGLTEESYKSAADFYTKFIKQISKCESIEVAETSKLLENSFRFINISFINEVAIFCQKLGIEVTDVIEAASTKPYGFMSFYPSLGAGGHCIPVDSMYLANKAKEMGVPINSIEIANKVNYDMPSYFVDRAEQKLGNLKFKELLVIGVSYKPNVSDTRETPVAALITGLKQRGAKVAWHDELVKEWNGEKSTVLSDQFDLAILATPHDYLDLTKLGDVPILNTRGSI